MNDDFIKRYRQRPDPHFVEGLYQQLNSTITPQRSYSMSKRILRPALLLTLALLLAAALTFTFSPSARAAIQSFFTFNGVSVGVDDLTGKLVTSGNKDAIVEQSDHEVTIKGKNGDIAMAGVAQINGRPMDVSKMLSQYPDLTLPSVPSTYTLQPQGQVMIDGSLVFTWSDAAGHFITYQRGPDPLHSIGPVEGLNLGDKAITVPSDGQVVSSTLNVESSTSSAGVANGATPLPLTTYSWKAGGYSFMLGTSDPSLSKADLQAMMP
jgi:hypothetical protein